MVPRLARRRLGLQPRILDRDAMVAVQPLLLHRQAVQEALVAGAGTASLAEFLARRVHGLVHPEVVSGGT